MTLATLTDWTAASIALATVASAVLLLVGLFVARSQLSQLNKATELENFMSLTQEADGHDFSVAYAFVVGLRSRTLYEKLNLPHQPEGEHLDRVLNFFERIGFLVSHKYLSGNLAVTWWGVTAKDAYDAVEDLIASQQVNDPGYCSEFKAFVATAEKHWLECGRKPQVGRKVPKAT